MGFSAAADELRLKNGDHLTGDVVAMEDGILVFKTDYSGRISVDWKLVNCLASENLQTFEFNDQSRISGRTECLPDGNIAIIEKDTGHSEIRSCSEVQAINPPAGIRFTGNIVAGGNSASGNTDARGANAATMLQVRADRHRLTMNARGNYNETNDTTDVQNAAGSLKYDFFLIEKFYTYAQLLVEHDRLQDLRTRVTVGPGIGYQFIESTRSSLFGEVGVSYVDENYYTPDDQDYYTCRWSVGLEHEIWPNRVKFFHLHEGYARVEEPDNYYIRSQQGFRLPLFDSFYANVQYDVDYKSRPTDENKHTDTRLLFGVGYDFEF
jgi:putative salt-induced outer membrane protein YdiY